MTIEMKYYKKEKFINDKSLTFKKKKKSMKENHFIMSKLCILYNEISCKKNIKSEII